MDKFIKKYLPRGYGHDCFTAVLPDGDRFRIYKIDYTFSSMGEEFVLRYYVSWRDLKRWDHKRKSLICGNFEDFIYETTPSNLKRKRIIGKALKTGIIKINRI